MVGVKINQNQRKIIVHSTLKLNEIPILGSTEKVFAFYFFLTQEPDLSVCCPQLLVLAHHSGQD